jgi:beta-glucosidase
VGGLSSGLEGEEMPVHVEGFKGGDRTHIELPGVQRNFIKALKEAGKKIVYVNCSGSAIALTPESERCEAILQAWYPGQEGGTAVTEVLYGDYNPQGKLPVTFYKDSNQLPDFEDYSMRGRTYRYFSDPLFAFGYGLSYTHFKVGKGVLNDRTLTIPVSNVGRRDGTEVIQIYVRRTDDTEGPIRTLKAIQRVTLKAGERKNVTLLLDDDAFTLFDSKSNTMRVVPGVYEVFYGTSSRPEDLKSLQIEL